MHTFWDRNQGVSRAVEPVFSITGSAEAAGLATRPDCCKRLPPADLIHRWRAWGQVRGAYWIESNGQSRSTHARTAS
jgi:hypothetical protein